MSSAGQFDVAVVGASAAGCTAARLYAMSGARVALIERRTDPAAYKVTCTHVIAPVATPTIERLGLAPLLIERGALRTKNELWSPHGGWFSVPDDFPDTWGITRRTLDPMLRELTVNTPGVEFFPGWTPTRMLGERRRPAGVEVENRNHDTLAIRARLVVGADGRDSAVARLAGVPGRVRPHNRFFYFAYWRGVQPATDYNRLWILDPDAAAQFPNEDGISVLVATFHRSRLAEVRADPEAAYMRRFTTLPDGPDLRDAERITKLIGRLQVPNVMRPAGRPGVAFAGDAALATDPLWAVGLGIAFQTADWLVQETSGALAGDEDLDEALRRYGRKFMWRLGPVHLMIADAATGRKLRSIERRVLRRATVDDEVARAFGAVLTRVHSPLRYVFDPQIAARLLVPRRIPPSPPSRAWMMSSPVNAAPEPALAEELV